MSDLERPYLKADYDHMPREPYAGLGYETHRYADYIPVADGADQFALRQSIESYGLIEPITLYQGAILDGRHRYAACVKMGVEPKFVEFEGDDESALGYVMGKNVARRNLSTAQKLMLRDKLLPEIERLRAAGKANMSTGGQGFQPVGNPVNTAKEVAKMVGVSDETIRQYDKVKDAAAEDTFMADLLEQVERGEVSVKKAYTSISDDLDKLAKQDAGKVDEGKQRAALVSAIGKAHALLINADSGVLVSDYTLVVQLGELSDWCEEALIYAR